MVMAEIKSEADSIGEDGSNDDSAQQNDLSEFSEMPESIHAHFRRYTTPMEFLPTSLVETSKDDDGGDDKGSNPTYILPVDPFNYFPFFNGFSNVNPFSQFYPPPPYLYPQYTNYMHHYANHGVGHPPAYPYPGAYGGGRGAYNFGGMMGGPQTGYPSNWGAPHPHMHYPFGAYKMDVSGPDVRTGSNNPPPFPQFNEISSTLITPELIHKPKENDDYEHVMNAIELAAEDEDTENAEIDSSDEEADSEMTSNVEFMNDDQETEMTSNVEFMNDGEDEAEMTSNVEFHDDSDETSATDEEGNVYDSSHVEYA